MIQQWIQEDSSLTVVLMNIAAQLYRENGLSEIQYKNITFKKGDILFTDEKWDQLKKELKYQEPLMNASNRPKVKQLYAFGTLEKFTSSDLDKYIKRINKIDGIKQLVLLPKYDGVGMRVYYGEMFLTRYDQQYGLDITYKAKKLLKDIPKNCILRGELMTLQDHEGYVTKRHYVSAMVNNEDPFPDDIIFICYEYLEEGVQLSFEQMLKKIKHVTRFKHPAIMIDKNDLSIDVIEEFSKKIPKEYQTDGIVIRPNEKEFSFENREKPQYQVAYKFHSQRFEGKLGSIIWTIKQQGYLQPTLVLQEPIIIDRSTIKKATGNNFNFLFQQNLIPGNKCLVSQKVVTRIEGMQDGKLQIEEYSKLIQPKCCPNCGGEIIVDEKSVDRFKCKDFYKNKCFNSILIMRAKEFLDIKGIGEKGLNKLIQQKDFDFMKWIQQFQPTQKQLFLILSDNIGLKKIDQVFTEQLLNDLLKLYNFK